MGSNGNSGLQEFIKSWNSVEHRVYQERLCTTELNSFLICVAVCNDLKSKEMFQNGYYYIPNITDNSWTLHANNQSFMIQSDDC